MTLEKLHQAKQTMAQAMRTSDSHLYATIYSEAGQILMEGGLTIQGRLEIEKQISSFMGLLGPMDTVYHTKDTWTQDDTIYESGHFSYTYVGRDEKPFYTGTYVFIWKVESDGTPYIYRNISIDD